MWGFLAGYLTARHGARASGGLGAFFIVLVLFGLGVQIVNHPDFWFYTYWIIGILLAILIPFITWIIIDDRKINNTNRINKEHNEYLAKNEPRYEQLFQMTITRQNGQSIIEEMEQLEPKLKSPYNDGNFVPDRDSRRSWMVRKKRTEFREVGGQYRR